MPAFTFEKISPPYRGAHSSHATQQTASSSPASSHQQSQSVSQNLGRFVEARTRDGNGYDVPPRRPLPK